MGILAPHKVRGLLKWVPNLVQPRSRFPAWNRSCFPMVRFCGVLGHPVPWPCWAPHPAETIPPGLDASPFGDFFPSFLCFIHKLTRQETFLTLPSYTTLSPLEKSRLIHKNITQRKTECNWPQPPMARCASHEAALCYSFHSAVVESKTQGREVTCSIQLLIKSDGRVWGLNNHPRFHPRDETLGLFLPRTLFYTLKSFGN